MPTTLLQALRERVLIFDGAMGTMVHAAELTLDDYDQLENCTEILNVTRPDVIQSIHEQYFAAGADVVETNTFGGMPHVLVEFGLQDRVEEINTLAVAHARAAARKYATPDRPRFVLGSMGPGTKLITLGQITWQQMTASYRALALALMRHGPGESVDGVIIETCQDILQIKAAVAATVDAQRELGLWGTPRQTPILVSLTIEQTGTMLLGTDIAAALTALSPLPIDAIGMNCATGPREMAQHLEHLGKHSPHPVLVFPNAGLPRLEAGKTVFPLQAPEMAQQVVELVERAQVNLVGGCCGTTPAHIAGLAQALENRPAPQRQPRLIPAISSLYQSVEYRQDTTILNIGERCNASGSRKFKQLLEAEDWDEVVALGREQMREGSHVLDINVDYAGRDNAADMAHVVSLLVRQVDAPLMLDSTQPATIEAGLQHAGGKCIINSANLEDGEEKFALMCQLAKRYGAALVLGCIDEDPQEAMARTADRKLAIATRMFQLATEKYGLQPHDLMFDPLVLPISTGMDKDRRSALETIEGTRRIAAALPLCQITCGLSNVSFGLKPAARQVLNSVFLHELIAAGMTSAILHVTKILPRTRIGDDLWHAALDLIYDRRAPAPRALRDGTLTDDPLQLFVDLFPDDAKEQAAKTDLAQLPLEERLRKHIIDGEKKGLTAALDEAMGQYTPLQIINDHLLAGMQVVGELFGAGEMQLPFVLQSAEVMKMSVAHLEPHMEKVEGQSKGVIVLATVKGDVHDIGKNLVDIILTNNGYTVHNLGIKQPIADILKAWRETGADAIGLSGLLVKSVNVMEESLREMVAQGVTAPVLLGGAALSRHYCESHLRRIYREAGGRVYHGRDAFEGLRIMDALKAKKLDELDAEIEQRLSKRAAAEELAAARQSERQDQSGGTATLAPARSSVATDVPIPTAPFWGDRVVASVPLTEIYPYINRVALYRGQWQFRKGALSDGDYEKLIAQKVDPIFEQLAQQCAEENILRPQVVYGYYPCNSEGDDLIVYDAKDHDREIVRFTFPRQQGRQSLCISDFFRSVESGQRDVLALHCVTVGPEVSRRAKALFENNNYQQYLYLHGFGVECAEALAELWHQRIRREMNIAGDDSPNVRELFTQHYRGSRYSFGYPACPDMADQAKLFHLLKPQRIGCELTENWQIDPEQSTSAIVVHHPEAKYFNV